MKKKRYKVEYTGRHWIECHGKNNLQCFDVQILDSVKKTAVTETRRLPLRPTVDFNKFAAYYTRVLNKDDKQIYKDLIRNGLQ